MINEPVFNDRKSHSVQIGLVDIYGAGRDLAQTLLERGHRVFHLQSASVVHPFYEGTDPDSNSYTGVLGVSSAIQDSCRQDGLKLDWLLPGSELGVVCAGEMAEILGSLGNSIKSAQVGSDKASLYRCLSEAGLRVPRGGSFHTPEAAASWASNFDIEEFVVKPRSSAGGDGVAFCSSLDELEAHARKLLARSSNALGRIEEEVIVQERINGTEYYINLVSAGGTHKITDIWRYVKSEREGHPIYDHETFVAPTDKLWCVLAEKAREVLDAVGVTHGAAHLEVFLQADEVIVVDLGLRLGGGSVPAILRAHGLTPQVDLLAMAIEDESQFSLWEEQHNSIEHGLIHFAGISHRSGIFRNQSIDELLSLTSCIFAARTQNSSEVTQTLDLFSSPITGYLSSPNPDTLWQDLATLRAWEKTGLYHMKDEE